MIYVRMRRIGKYKFHVYLIDILFACLINICLTSAISIHLFTKLAFTCMRKRHFTFYIGKN